jgi:hypothetical protein
VHRLSHNGAPSSRLFAGNVGLLPGDSFLEFLRSRRARLATFVPKVEELWERMNAGGFFQCARPPRAALQRQALRRGPRPRARSRPAGAACGVTRLSLRLSVAAFDADRKAFLPESARSFRLHCRGGRCAPRARPPAERIGPVRRHLATLLGSTGLWDCRANRAGANAGGVHPVAHHRVCRSKARAQAGRGPLAEYRRWIHQRESRLARA